METIYNRIEKRRKELGMSQDELALLVGYKEKSSISHIEKGRKDIPQTKIVAFAKALKTTPSYLMDGYDLETIYNQIMNMDRFDQMILINRLIKMYNEREEK